MRRATALAVATAMVLVVCACAGAATPRDAVPAPLPRGVVAGTACPAFPDDNWWHADVSTLPVHERSDDWLARIGTDADLHPDFGPTRRYGIPVTVVGEDHRRVRVRFRYGSESDRVGYPLGRDTRIEGGRRSSGDRHAIVVDEDRCRLYETWLTRRRDDGWHAGSGATWKLTSNDLRPDGWTSADAAGLPILPGLLTWPEVRDDRIDHAIRFTVEESSEHHIWPARHDAGSHPSCRYVPMGARFRFDPALVPAFDVGELGAAARRVVEAMETYGIVVADNGSDWFFQGATTLRWPDALIADLKLVPAAGFEAVDTASIIDGSDPC